MFDINNQYTGKLFGQDRIGHITPDLEFSDVLRPYLPVAYPAPYLPGLRQDQGHPKLANIVLSSQHLVGVDKSGAIVPAGLFCGVQGRLGNATITNVAVAANVATITANNNYVVGDVINQTVTGQTALTGQFTVASASGTQYTFNVTTANVASTAATGTAALAKQGQYCILVYGINDVGFAFNAQTGAYVQSAGEHAVLAVPSDATPGAVTLPDGTVVAVSAADITFAQTCNLFDTGVVKPIGCAVRIVYQYIGGVTVKSLTGGMLYVMNGVVPTKFVVHNYMHEMGTAVQTQYVIKLPWIGATRYTISQLAAADGITGYNQGYGLTFAHFTGTPLRGEAVVATSTAQDYGNYTNYVVGTHSAGQVIGRVLGVMNMIDRIGFANRVRTLWDSDRLVGPVKDPNPASIAMGGSATGGIDNTLFLHTDGILKKAITQNKPQRPEYGTYVIVRVNL